MSYIYIFCNGNIRTGIDLNITTLFKQVTQNPIIESKMNDQK